MKTKLLVIVCLIGLTAISAQSAKFEWVAGVYGNEYASAIAADAGGNVYITGWFIGTVDFDPGADTFNLTNPSGLLFGPDMYILKLNARGNFMWVKHFDAAISGSCNSTAIKVDNAGNVYTIGRYALRMDFDPGIGTFYLDSKTPSSDAYSITDIFVSKLDSAGNFVWAKSMGGEKTDEGSAIFVDAMGNVYTTGYFTGTADFDPGTGIFEISTEPLTKDIFISKLNSSGEFKWAKSIKSASSISSNSCTSLGVDKSGNLYATGNFSHSIDFDPGDGIANLTADGYTTDVFVLKLNAAGNFVWAKRMGGISNDWAISLALDASTNVYTTGGYSDSADFDPGNGIFNLAGKGYQDMFISKLDSAGNFVWAKSMGGPEYDQVISIALDGSGNCYATGSYNGTADFDPGVEIVNLTAAGWGDAFILKLNPAGNFVWVKNIGGVTEDFGTAIAVDNLNNIFTMGFFSGTVDFDPGPDVFNLSTSGHSTFIHKMSQATSHVKPIPVTTTSIIYPNPSTGLFTIAVPTPSTGATIEIYNSLGALIYKQTQVKELNTVKIADQSKGLYFIKITNNELVETQKLIKQ